MGRNPEARADRRAHALARPPADGAQAPYPVTTDRLRTFERSGHLERGVMTAPLHSITSSARASSAVGPSRPRLFAVLRLIASSYFVGACTGKSAGFSPLRMRST